MAHWDLPKKRVIVLIKRMLYLAAQGNFILYLHHIAGINNSIAAAFSRQDMPWFGQLAAKTAQAPPVPASTIGCCAK